MLCLLSYRYRLDQEKISYLNTDLQNMVDVSRTNQIIKSKLIVDKQLKYSHKKIAIEKIKINKTTVIK